MISSRLLPVALITALAALLSSPAPAEEPKDKPGFCKDCAQETLEGFLKGGNKVVQMVPCPLCKKGKPNPLLEERICEDCAAKARVCARCYVAMGWDAAMDKAPTAAKGRILFVSTRDAQTNDVYSMAPTGKDVKRVTETPEHEMDLAVSADGRWITFTANFNKKWDICTMEARGGACRRLLKSPEDEFNPSFFPDGKRVCAARTTGGTMKMVVFSREGGSEVVIEHGEPVPAAFPEVSPDGKRIAFVGGENPRDANAYEIYVWEMENPADPSKGKCKRLTNNEVMDTDPSFSPDGKRILYTCNGNGDDDVWMMNADGSDPKCVFARPGVQDLAPVFSPDGKKAAFAAYSNPAAQGNDAEIWTLDLATKKVEQITKNEKKDLKPRWR